MSRILVVEDESAIAELISINLRHAGFEVTIAASAEQAQAAVDGVLPDLFKEGKGVVAQGSVGADGVFHATEVLAKHDENYMPPAAAGAIEKAQKDKGMSMNSMSNVK